MLGRHNTLVWEFYYPPILPIRMLGELEILGQYNFEWGQPDLFMAIAPLSGEYYEERGF